MIISSFERFLNMDMKIYRDIHLRVISILMCLLLAVIPFFHPKKVNANPAIVFAGIISILATGMIAGKYVSDTVLTQEQINNANDYCTANLQAAFPDPAEYNKQLGILQNLDNDIKAGKDIDWSKYSGKALYAVLKGVVDVVWPYSGTGTAIPNSKYIGTANGFEVYVTSGLESGFPALSDVSYKYVGVHVLYRKSIGNGVKKDSFKIYAHNLSTLANASYDGVFYNYNNELRWQTKDMYPVSASDAIVYVFGFIPEGKASGNVQKVPNLTAKTANKLKLPTRLPQTVINNINNYYNGDTENLTIAPTPEELPTLPDGYNPVTDDLPDLPGYEDVTPDQEPTTDPEPTPTPPDPTPTPPEYNGDEWVNPIGNFFDGLLKFMKAAFVPTLSLDLSALSNMPENFTDKFPFSLPSDIVSIFGVINADPVAPSFSFTFPLSYVGGEDMDASFNLDNFNDAAAVIRSLLLLVVVVLLAWKTYGIVGGDS